MSKTHNRWLNAWSSTNDECLMELVRAGVTRAKIGCMMDRTENAVTTRLRILRKRGIMEPYALKPKKEYLMNSKGEIRIPKKVDTAIPQNTPIAKKLASRAPSFSGWYFGDQNLNG